MGLSSQSKLGWSPRPQQRPGGQPHQPVATETVWNGQTGLRANGNVISCPFRKKIRDICSKSHLMPRCFPKSIRDCLLPCKNFYEISVLRRGIPMAMTLDGNLSLVVRPRSDQQHGKTIFDCVLGRILKKETSWPKPSTRINIVLDSIVPANQQHQHDEQGRAFPL